MLFRLLDYDGERKVTDPEFNVSGKLARGFYYAYSNLLLESVILPGSTMDKVC
jgi:hypothetical protein